LEEREMEENKMATHHKGEGKEENKTEIKKEVSEIKLHLKKKLKTNMWKYTTIALAVVLVGVVIFMLVKNLAPKATGMIVLNDKRCSECDVTQLLTQLKTIFPDMKVKTLDYNDAAGKALYTQLKITYLPAILFDKSVEKTSGYSQIQQYLATAGNYYSLRIVASFEPTKEICDNGIDDTGNGLIDCADPDCTNAFACREEKKNSLMLFIMSDCPYGKLAVEALKELADNFESNLQYEVHYIASEVSEGVFNSLHGTYEADEDIVQLCVNKHSPAQWLDYINCRSLEGIKGNDWHVCANQTNVDIAKVEACANGAEGKQLLAEDIKIAEGLGISASPTWIANNRYQFGGIYAETVKTQFCKYNSNTKGCENTLNSTSSPSGSC